MRTIIGLVAAWLITIPLTADAKNNPPNATLIDAAIKVCVPKAQNWESRFDAFYNPATDRVENNEPNEAVLDEMQLWHQAMFTFKKCMNEQGLPLS